VHTQKKNVFPSCDLITRTTARQLNGKTEQRLLASALISVLTRVDIVILETMFGIFVSESVKSAEEKKVCRHSAL
jgi:hypothetical protein